MLSFKVNYNSTWCQKLANTRKMANFKLSPPEPFNFSSPEDWPRWIRRYERFRQASNLHLKSNKSQVNNLIYSMGDQTDDILRSFGLSEEEMKNYTIVKGKFEGHFVKRQNTIYERAKFNQRKQEDGETEDSILLPCGALSIRRPSQRDDT